MKKIYLLTGLLVILGSGLSKAQWSANPVQNTLVSNATASQAAANQANVHSISDGAGGLVLVYEDASSGTSRITAQHLNAGGVKLWGKDGITVTDVISVQTDPRIISAGGTRIIITWVDHRNNNADIYTQGLDIKDIDDDATVDLGPGLAVCTTPGINEKAPSIATDGNGGAFIAWTDGQAINIQRVNSSGNLLLSGNTFDGNQSVYFADGLVADGNGGVILTFAVIDLFAPSSNHIVSDYIDQAGNVTYGQGNFINLPLSLQHVCSDNNGGIYYTYVSNDFTQPPFPKSFHLVHVDQPTAVTPSGSLTDIVVDPDMDPQALINQDNYYTSLNPDNSGGAVVAWNSSSSGSHGLHAEHFDQNGIPQWQTSVFGNTFYKNIVTSKIPTTTSEINGMSGTRLGTGDYVFIYPQINGTNIHYYAQKLSGINGSVQWTAGTGVPVTTAANVKHNPGISVSGSNIIASWDDNRNSNSDVYAQRLNPVNGSLPVKLTQFDAKYVQNAVQLTWQTASEINNDRFEIERSEDGKTFVSAGSVKGNKTTSILSEYAFTDHDLNVSVNYLYYRLNQVDMDGQSEHSPVKAVKIPSLNTGLVLKTYPNPANSFIYFTVSGEKNNSGSYKLYNTNGKVVLSSAYTSLKEGINIENLTSGVYILEVASDGSIWNQKVVKN